MKILTEKEAGFTAIRELDNGIKLGLMEMTFTFAICYDVKLGLLDKPYKYRYCYDKSNAEACFHEFAFWNGEGDPSGNWIKKKGVGYDETNPNYIET